MNNGANPEVIQPQHPNALVAAANQQTGKPGLIEKMAAQFQIQPQQFYATIKQTIMPDKGNNVTHEQVAAFLIVANKYQLNPFTKEIYAFPAKGGGIQPIVGIDGWSTIINRQPEFDGMEFEDHLENGKLISITCKIFRKDRQRATEVTEYMEECKRPTEPWQKWPARMLRHKAMIQAARYAFGLSGIVDPDEAERIAESNLAPMTPATDQTTIAQKRTQELADRYTQQQPIAAVQPQAQPAQAEPEPAHVDTPEELDPTEDEDEYDGSDRGEAPETDAIPSFDFNIPQEQTRYQAAAAPAPRRSRR